MPCPFPGMDPYIESQWWPDFHGDFLFAVRQQLVEQVRPRYLVMSELRIYVEHGPVGSLREHIRPDLSVLENRPERTSGHYGMAVADRAPAIITLPVPEEIEERYLEIRVPETQEVVTVIEVLSPANKKIAGDGRRAYMERRDQVLMTRTSLVELDLLRGGARLPALSELPPADYYAFVSRGLRRPVAEAYNWTLRQPLPTIPIPLMPDEPDALLDLQGAFTEVYERAGYDYSITYTRAVEPPLNEEDREWAAGLTAGAGGTAAV